MADPARAAETLRSHPIKKMAESRHLAKKLSDSYFSMAKSCSSNESSLDRSNFFLVEESLERNLPRSAVDWLGSCYPDVVYSYIEMV